MEEEELEEHMVVGSPSGRRGVRKTKVHRAVEDSFESLHEDRLRSWLEAKNEGLKVATYPKFPSAGSTRFITFR
jgi:hypothetical protein